MFKGFTSATVFLTFILAANQVYAVDATTELLAKKGVITAEEYAKIKATEASKGSVDLTDGLKFVSADKSTTAQLGTLLQMDYDGYNSDIKDSKGRDLANSGTEFRRVRLYMAGTIASDWDYRTEIDFATTAQLVDGYVTYKGWQESVPMTLTVGHFKIPFSQESLAADKGLTFMERSLPNAFLNARAPGAMIAAGKDNWSSSFMVFGEQLSTPAAAVSDEGGGASFRGTWAPLIGPDVTVHLGASYMVRIPSQDNVTLGSGTTLSYTEGVRLRSKPESNIIETRLVDTGATGIIDLDQTRLSGVEAGVSAGSVLFNAEYIDTQITRKNGKSDLDFDGWFVQGAWTITGEGHTYQGNKGLFDGVKPAHPTNQGGYGAWELALRVSEINLNDGAQVLTAGKLANEINGGDQRDLTLALNWYLNSNFRISANYVKVLDIEGGSFDNASLSAMQLRFQLAY